MQPIKHLFLTVAMLLALTVSAGNTIVVELDRMAGTAFPLAEVVGGKTVTVSSIYKKVGITLTIQEDETAISRLVDPISPTDPVENEFITLPEIDNLMSSHRYSPVGPITNGKDTQYHVYGVIVDHYFETPDGIQSIDMMGVTVNPPTGVHRPFAIFYKNINISGNNAKFLRTTAHEIGHVLNLHHEDGNGRKSLMNTSETVGSNFEFRFRNCEKNHLKKHPKSYVWPELMPKSTVEMLHPHLHGSCN